MNTPLQGSRSAQVEAFLSRAYQRIQRTVIVLSVVAAILATLLFGWRSGLGFAIGALVGYINFISLHRASAMMTERMVAPGGKAPSKLGVVLASLGRYIFVIGAAYVIFKSQPRMLAGFTAALFFPIVAATCEGVYEAFKNSNTDEI
jgi:Na+/H+-translocating membrane pyrophosphatase